MHGGVWMDVCLCCWLVNGYACCLQLCPVNECHRGRCGTASSSGQQPCMGVHFVLIVMVLWHRSHRSPRLHYSWLPACLTELCTSLCTTGTQLLHFGLWCSHAGDKQLTVLHQPCVGIIITSPICPGANSRPEVALPSVVPCITG